MRCDKWKHSFWQNPVGDLLLYLSDPGPWANKIVSIAHNVKAFDRYVILNRAILLKWRPKLIMNGQKIMCMKTEHLSGQCVLPPMSPVLGVRGLRSDGLQIVVPSRFQYEKNLHYTGPILDVSYFGVNEMDEKESTEIHAWYESHARHRGDEPRVCQRLRRLDLMEVWGRGTSA